VTVARVPWARHGAGHTRDFDDQAAWLAVHVSKSAVVQLLRVAWRTVGAIVERVGSDIDTRVDRLEGLTRIGMDEISYKRGYRSLFIVVDHDTGRLVWASPGKDEATVNRFFDDLGPERTAGLTHISADMAPWIARVVKRRAPAFLERAKGRKVFDQAARTGGHASSGQAHRIFVARHALWKNPEHLSERQRQQLSFIEASEPRLWRAYLLKEGLRLALSLTGNDGREALEDWISWARRSRITDHRSEIETARDSGLSNALVESTNTKIRLLARIAYGFHGPQPLIALAMLSLGGHCPSLPGQK
jgi:transposase